MIYHFEVAVEITAQAKPEKGVPWVVTVPLSDREAELEVPLYELRADGGLKELQETYNQKGDHQL